MELKDFSDEIIEKGSKIDIDFTEEMVNKFYRYMSLLIEWNEKINLTAITEPKDIILKHFIDSITINTYLDNSKKVMDIGTGAGFPGIPLKIIHPEMDVTLMDSLNKRITFLQKVCEEISLSQIECVHARAEELAKDRKYREQYDIVTSRAVAKLSILLEYMLPFTKIGGKCICMKGSNVEEELREASRAIEVLGGSIERVDKFLLPDTDMERNIIVIKKIKRTPNMYPRKAGMPAKQPII